MATTKKTLEELNAARWEDLTPEERSYRGHIAFEEARRAAKEVAARNGGPDPVNSAETIRQMREDRTRYLVEMMGMIPPGDDAAWEEHKALVEESFAEDRRERERNAGGQS